MDETSEYRSTINKLEVSVGTLPSSLLTNFSQEMNIEVVLVSVCLLENVSFKLLRDNSF